MVPAVDSSRHNYRSCLPEYPMNFIPFRIQKVRGNYTRMCIRGTSRNRVGGKIHGIDFDCKKKNVIYITRHIAVITPVAHLQIGYSKLVAIALVLTSSCTLIKST